MSIADSFPETAADATLRFLQQRPDWRTPTGYLAVGGPLEDRIDPVEVRAEVVGGAIELVVVFEHRAFPGRTFGLRSGPLWSDDSSAESFLDDSGPDEVGVEFGNWAEDVPFLFGLESATADTSGVVWLRPTWLESVDG